MFNYNGVNFAFKEKLVQTFLVDIVLIPKSSLFISVVGLVGIIRMSLNVNLHMGREQV